MKAGGGHQHQQQIKIKTTATNAFAPSMLCSRALHGNARFLLHSAWNFRRSRFVASSVRPVPASDGCGASLRCRWEAVTEQ